MTKIRLLGITEVMRSTTTGINLTDYIELNYNDVAEYQENLLLEDTIDIQKTKQIDSSINKVLVKKGDIIFPIKQKNHTPKFVNWSEDIDVNYRYNGEIIIVRVIADIVNKKFLYFALNSPDVKDFINELASHLTPNRITCEMIGNLEIDLPELSIQNQIIEELEKLNTEKIKIENQFKEYIKIIKK